MSKKKKIIGVVCGVVAVAVVGGYLLLNQNSGAAVMVSTETLQQMDLQNTVSLTGVVESETDRKVYSTLSYLVESVNVQVGDVVQAGDVLAQLDTEQLEMDIAQQQAAVDASNSQSAHQIEVNRKAYENAVENYENGLDSNAISAESGVNQAESSLTQAEYGVDSAQLQVDAAEAAVRDARPRTRWRKRRRRTMRRLQMQSRRQQQRSHRLSSLCKNWNQIMRQRKNSGNILILRTYKSINQKRISGKTRKKL